MSRIKIMPDSRDLSKPKHVPKSHSLVDREDRFRPSGGKPPLPIDKVYNRQDGK